jgi:hypothetical protein
MLIGARFGNFLLNRNHAIKSIISSKASRHLANFASNSELKSATPTRACLYVPGKLLLIDFYFY